ncbi:MAG: orotidine-5'-phosphate decarboxylase [Bacteroidales bacterium]|nr:orotidine-5'-phosphate decarboxylase [Bacteroidales bacterium]
MNYNQLFQQIVKKQSFLCVGLDSDIKKLPKHLLNTDDSIFNFNKEIIDATAKYCVAFKPNIAFYESLGSDGISSFEKTINYCRKNYPDIFLIADAKRGDIGNTSDLYARAFFEKMNVDAITVAPYMGEDSVSPFLAYENKWVILLALTSNKGADDFQYFEQNGQKLFEKVLEKSQNWGNKENMMYVIGATRAEMLAEVRKIVPEHFLLVPGIGAQGGSLQNVVEHGMNKHCGLLVNSSRGIIFADNSEKFAEKAGDEAKKIQLQMKDLLIQKKIL